MFFLHFFFWFFHFFEFKKKDFLHTWLRFVICSIIIKNLVLYFFPVFLYHHMLPSRQHYSTNASRWGASNQFHLFIHSFLHSFIHTFIITYILLFHSFVYFATLHSFHSFVHSLPLYVLKEEHYNCHRKTPSFSLFYSLALRHSCVWCFVKGYKRSLSFLPIVYTFFT